jgi:hypothetical protein
LGVPDDPSTSGKSIQPRSASTITAAGLLLLALAVIVFFTRRPAFLSPIALVVVAAIGIAALLLQVRLQPGARSQGKQGSSRVSVGFTALGVVFGLGAVFGDVFRFKPAFVLADALAAVGCFAVSGIIVLNALRKHRVP